MDSEAPGDVVQEYFERYRGYAEALATEIWKTLPSHVEREELVQYALLGLGQAAQRFDASRGAKFETFAYLRIRGAVFDGIKENTDMSPALRRSVNEGRASDMVSMDVDLDETDTDKICRQLSESIRRIGMVFLVSQLGPEEDDMIDGEDAETPAARASRNESSRRVTKALERLDPKDRDLVIQFHVHGRTLTDIADEEGVHKSTIHRRHRTAMEQLRQFLEE